MTINKLADGQFSKERLIGWSIVAVAEAKRRERDYPESVEAAAGVCLAEIALAALTAEPEPLKGAERQEPQEYRKLRAVPEGWVAVPAEPTGDMLARIRLSDVWTGEPRKGVYVQGIPVGI
ncbi:hypothetical protein WAA39_002336 [Enterobacter mori]|jgi:hypothetical protein|uniref:hypothetical protein n=1 Tax=Enterobacter mori TaxID=539813 RepID=UPI0025C76F03|nr:hypothetical protein [Enterobacter mori]EME8859698.1 hypothetical protein [Enterobacter mori]